MRVNKRTVEEYFEKFSVLNLSQIENFYESIIQVHKIAELPSNVSQMYQNICCLVRRFLNRRFEKNVNKILNFDLLFVRISP